ncbi:hypothetical protein J1TS1_28530 [Shouchella clausii]|uniref:hypothetical protein n=1 Tax=Shouchella clausii TaxID=79880 RepID=UPI001B27369C|nr:hypothetical protein [Shouchella clausii]GIN08708.1 hypothetical protein J1TS1_28530 [Shouchella clausii]
MDVMEAAERVFKLNSDIEKLSEWVAHLNFNDKPITGMEWLKLQRAIERVTAELVEERNALEEEVKQSTKGIKIITV